MKASITLLTMFLLPLLALSAEEKDEVRYNQDVLPILADHCFQCHGFDKAQRKAGLRLDLAVGAMAVLDSGERAITPGKVAESGLIGRILTTDADDLMPPKKTGKHLTAEQKETLRRWVEQGAKYEPHWAYIPPVRVEPPSVPGSAHPVDRFIRARLAEEKIAPAPEADRATVIRRVSFDLTGLPPSPLEVDAFLTDARADAYERVVERLLASEHFGERWARWWLDLAHYADSDGYLQDFLRPVAWRYRQWVVEAFNRDLPFDEFTELQADWERRLLETEAKPGVDFDWDRTLELLGLQWGQNLGEGQLEGLNIIKTPRSQRTQDQRDRLLDYFLKNRPTIYAAQFKELKLDELRTKLDALQKDLPAITRAPAMMQAVLPRATHIHVRGEFHRKGDEVHAGTPAAMPGLAKLNDANRLDLARWLVSPQHPLTARVVVNRLWQELFGRGIVATSENFGVRGERPSHPELLDWLALEFMREGWSVKAMLRQIVLSQSYRQSSVARPELATRDPLNKLVARQSRLRLSGEAVRDAALAASGLLNRNVGGPSVKPPQPSSVSTEGYKNLWETSLGADRYRRGLYTFIQRTSPFAQFVTFDLPDTSRSCARRERSNTPLQALNLLNDPVFLEAAQALAARVHREARGGDEPRLAHAFTLVLSRMPTPAESKRLLAYLQQQKSLFEKDSASTHELAGEEGGADHAAWIALASVLLNLDETINRE